MQQLVAGRVSATTTVAEAMVRKVATVSVATPASDLLSIFERGEIALVIDDDRHLLGLVTKMDLIDIVSGRKMSPVSRRPSSGH
jgi:cystathionine beta-synthase